MSINITNKVMRERMAHIAQNEELVPKRDELLTSLTISKEFLDELDALGQWAILCEQRDELLSDLYAINRVLNLYSRAIDARHEMAIRALRAHTRRVPAVVAIEDEFL